VCFSAEADLVAGLIVGAVGIDAVRHVRRPSERALAAVPVVLAAHQLIEAFVWWGLEHREPSAVVRPAVWLYLLVAFGVLPVLVPFAVGALEPAAVRRRIGALTTIGIAVAIVLMYTVVRGPAEAAIRGHEIAYRVQLWHGEIIVVLYVLATCGSMLLSAHRHVRWFGAANLIAVVLLAWLDKDGFISLWCGWAAVTSVAIAVHLRYAPHTPEHVVLTETPG
jgi:uncharacterized protein DUF6629